MGILLGKSAGPSVTQVVNAIRQIMGDLTGYIVPLIILGLITPAIVFLKKSAGRVLTITLIVYYLSSVGVACFSFLAGQAITPNLHIQSAVAQETQISEAVFKFGIAPIISVITTLATVILLGIVVIWIQSKIWEDLLMELNQVVLTIVGKVAITILPVYITATFVELVYEGVLLGRFPVFIKITFIVLVGYFIWMALFYSLGGIPSKSSPKEVFKHYAPTYMTAIETMSSAATVPVALACARKSTILNLKVRDSVVPFCSNTHLYGSVLIETFLVIVISQILCDQLPSASSMTLFILLLEVSVIAAPRVPGGAVVASLGLITSVLHFDNIGTALILSIFALQDSFGTACSITGDGAIALMVTGIFKREKAK